MKNGYWKPLKIKSAPLPGNKNPLVEYRAGFLIVIGFNLIVWALIAWALM